MFLCLLRFQLLACAQSGLLRELTDFDIDDNGGVYVITDAFKKLIKYLGA